MHPLLLTLLLTACLARPLWLLQQDPVPAQPSQSNDDAFLVVSSLDRDDFVERYQVNELLARNLRYRKDSTLEGRVLLMDRHSPN